MRRPHVLLLFLLCSGLHAQVHRVGVDPRVELMSIIFRLAGNGEYSQGRVPAYNQAIDRHFAPFREHEAVQLARNLRQTDGVSFDAVMSMAVHLSDVETLGERVPFDAPRLELDRRWHGVKARAFLAAARKFAAESNFNTFLQSQRPLYETTDARLRAFVEKNADLEWFGKFFGTRAPARFVVVPGLANGGSSYGAAITVDGGEREIYAIPGVWQVDGEGKPWFQGDWSVTLVHEFVHSFANPHIDRAFPRLERAGNRLFEATAEIMRRQAYGSGKIVLYESLVRAATCRYIFDHQGPEAAARAVEAERARGFFWTDGLFDLLGTYARERERYATLEAFMPRVVEFFDSAAAQPERLVAAYDESRPKVVSMSIADGAADVDPATTAITIRFDRPMARTGYSVARNGAVEFPNAGIPSFDEAGTVFTLPVKLQPGKEYGFSLNWPGGGNFRSAAGVLMKPVPVKFRTRAAAAPGGPLEHALRTRIAGFQGTVSLYAKNLETGAAAGIRESEPVRTASTIKLPIMLAVFDAVARGQAKWDEQLTVSAAGKVPGSGVIASEISDGVRLPLRDVVHLMIVLSDNSATNMVLERVPADAVNAYLDRLGIRTTRVLRKVRGDGQPARGISAAGKLPENQKYGLGVSTARDMVAMLEKLHRGEIVSPEASLEMLAILGRCQDNTGIRRRLAGMRVANKTGALDALRADSGIVWSKSGPIAISITVDGMPKVDYTPDNAGSLLIADLAKMLVEGLARR